MIMNITPDVCGQFNKEVRNWESGNYKNVKLRCNKPLDCDYCASVETGKFIRPIKKHVANGGEIYTNIVTGENWDKVRKWLQRNGCNGYDKFPLVDGTYALITDIPVNRHVYPLIHPDIAYLALDVFRINNSQTRPKRVSTGVFSDKKSKDDGFIVEWPDPQFVNKKTGERVPSSTINWLIKDFLQYLSPFIQITRENVNFYLDYKSRLKADLVTMLDNDIGVIGFNVAKRVLTEDDMSKWNIIPLTAPDKAVLENNPNGKALVDMIFFGMVSSYEDYPRNIQTWTDYKSDNERIFEKLVGGA